MSLHKEIELENEICLHLASDGWLYSEGDTGLYDRKHALLPDDLWLWLRATQPKAWETLLKKYGAAVQAVLLERIRAQLDERGTLDVLRHGLELVSPPPASTPRCRASSSSAWPASPAATSRSQGH